MEFFWITYSLFAITWKTFDLVIPRLCSMRPSRVFNFGSQEHDHSQSYGYGGGGGATPQMNSSFHRDFRTGVVGQDDTETWVPTLPNVRDLDQQGIKPKAGTAVSDPPRETRSPESPRSPILGARTTSSSLGSISGTSTITSGYIRLLHPRNHTRREDEWLVWTRQALTQSMSSFSMWF